MVYEVVGEQLHFCITVINGSECTQSVVESQAPVTPECLKTHSLMTECQLNITLLHGSTAETVFLVGE